MNKNSNRCPIVVDAMGGDFAPEEIVKGAACASANLGLKIILVGNQKKIKEAAEISGSSLEGIDVASSTQEVKMDDHPSEVIKNKKQSSVYIGTQILAENKCGAFLSAGNTGAVMACSLFNIKRIEGILRPAIAIVVPLAEKKVVLIDAGANVDCKSRYLKQFAIMGKVYSENIIGVSNPSVGLINVGTEEKKGNKMAVEAFQMLKDLNINFIGNIEGRDIFNGKADVVVCDGFVGNVLLKSIEGIVNLFFSEIKGVLTHSFLTKLSALGLKKSFLNMKKKFDYEEYGGAQLLGVNGIVIISHGSSKSKAIFNAAKVAQDGVRTNLVEKIKNEVKD